MMPILRAYMVSFASNANRAISLALQKLCLATTSDVNFSIRDLDSNLSYTAHNYIHANYCVKKAK